MIVLGSSLFVALVINPVFTAMWMKVDESKKKKKTPLIIAGIFVVFGFILLGVSTGAGNLFIVIGLLVILN